MGLNINIRPLREEDIMAISPQLRKLDITECLIGTGLTVEEALSGAAKTTEPYTAFINDEIACVFGVDVKPDGTVVWMMCTPVIENLAYRHTILRIAKYMIASFVAKYGVLSNYVWARNKTALRFIRHLGGKALDSIVVNDETFIKIQFGW